MKVIQTDALRLLAGICDDNREERLRIEQCLKQAANDMDGLSVECRLFESGEELLTACREQRFQLALLDVEMPGMDGFELAERIHGCSRDTALVFVSRHESFVFDAQDYMPLWFVRKSCLSRDLKKALRKYAERAGSGGKCLSLTADGERRDLPLSSVVFLESDKHRILIHTADGGTCSSYGALRHMEKLLEPEGFLRVHKSFLVNRAYIVKQDGLELSLGRYGRAVVGRDKRKMVREAVRDRGVGMSWE